MANRQTDIFGKANCMEMQLNDLSQRMNTVKRLKAKIVESHVSSERKLTDITGSTSTINADEKQERLIVSQVRHAFFRGVQK